jgi:hypothetical protein
MKKIQIPEILKKIGGFSLIGASIINFFTNAVAGLIQLNYPYNVLLNVGIIALIIGCLYYYFYIKKASKITFDNIMTLTDLELSVSQESILKETTLFEKYNVVYFPAVPTNNPNIIHLLFAFYIRELVKLGISVNMFIFDYYYIYVKNKEQTHNVSYRDVEEFKNFMSKHTSRTSNLKIIKETSFISKKRKSKSVLISMLNFSVHLTCKAMHDIQEVKEHYINEKTEFIKYMKPLFNMLYLKHTSKKYGFTLSGLDEKPLWDAYQQNINVREDYKLCNLYIPTIENSHVLDKSRNNIYKNDDKNIVLEKVISNFNVDNKSDIKGNSSVSLFVKILIFKNEQNIRYNTGIGNIIEIKNWDSFVHTLFEDSITEKQKQSIYESITNQIYNMFNL